MNMEKEMQERSKLFEDWKLPDAKDKQSARYGAAIFQDYAIETGRVEFHVCKPDVIVFQTEGGYNHEDNKGDTLYFEATLEELVLDAAEGVTQGRCYFLKCAEVFEKAAAQLREIADHPDQVEDEDDHNDHS